MQKRMKKSKKKNDDINFKFIAKKYSILGGTFTPSPRKTPGVSRWPSSTRGIGEWETQNCVRLDVDTAPYSSELQSK